MNQNDAGVRELRALIQRFPNAPEAMQARSSLSGMGIATTYAAKRQKPSPSRLPDQSRPVPSFAS